MEFKCSCGLMVGHKAFFFHKDHKPFNGYVNFWAFLEDHHSEKEKANNENKVVMPVKIFDHAKVSAITSKKQGWDRSKYNAYQREYMRKKRETMKESTNG